MVRFHDPPVIEPGGGKKDADGRGRVTTDLHHLAENAGLGCDDARFALGDMERRGEIEVVIFPDYYGDGLIRLRPKPWKPFGAPVYDYGRRPTAQDKEIRAKRSAGVAQKIQPDLSQKESPCKSCTYRGFCNWGIRIRTLTN